MLKGLKKKINNNNSKSVSSRLWLHIKVCQSGSDSAPDIQKYLKKVLLIYYFVIHCYLRCLCLIFSPPLPPLPGQPSAEPWGSAPGFFLLKGVFPGARLISCPNLYVLMEHYLAVLFHLRTTKIRQRSHIWGAFIFGCVQGRCQVGVAQLELHQASLSL